MDNQVCTAVFDAEDITGAQFSQNPDSEAGHWCLAKQ